MLATRRMHRLTKDDGPAQARGRQRLHEGLGHRGERKVEGAGEGEQRQGGCVVGRRWEQGQGHAPGAGTDNGGSHAGAKDARGFEEHGAEDGARVPH